VAHGIGNAFYEQLIFDEGGQLLNASLMDYLLPTALDVPKVEMGHLETPSPLNPTGAKGVGEAGAIPTGALFAQAVEDALQGTGVEILEIPLSPNRLFALMREAEQAHSGGLAPAVAARRGARTLAVEELRFRRTGTVGLRSAPRPDCVGECDARFAAPRACRSRALSRRHEGRARPGLGGEFTLTVAIHDAVPDEDTGWSWTRAARWFRRRDSDGAARFQRSWRTTMHYRADLTWVVRLPRSASAFSIPLDASWCSGTQGVESR
jgi:hypothetical protein